MLSSFDYVVVVFYLVFLLGIGWFFRRTGHDSSEYFRGSGRMAWWMVGASSFMGSFSAWTFTGAAGLAYDTGLVVLVIYFGNSLGYFINWAYFARLGRNTRAVTALEAVRERLGVVNEQVFTWLQVPFQVLQAGIWLYGLAIFCTPVFGLDLRATILICGIVVVFVAAAGGSWAVIVGDFIQALVLVPITLVAAYTALQLVGGPVALLEKLPAGHRELVSAGTGFGPWWLLAVMLEKITNNNALHCSSRYLCVSTSRDARRAAALSSALFLVGSIVWFIPPLVARALGTPLGRAEGIANPAEMSYIAVAAQCLPAGVMGLLVTGIVSSTMSAMDTGLNRNAGIFVRSFYLPVLRPAAGERELVLAGRATTWIFGGLAILMALFYSSWRDLGVFQLMMNFSALVSTPYAVPLFWCLILRRSPDWAAWSTIALCCLVGASVSLLPKSAAVVAALPDGLAGFLAWVRAHNYIAITVANTGLGSLWFLTASALAGRRPPAPGRAAQVAAFFQRLDQDVTAAEGGEIDVPRHRSIARMCLLYGGFIGLLALISVSWPGRLGLAFCSLFMVAVGWGIRRSLAR